LKVARKQTICGKGVGMAMSELGHIVHDVITFILCALSFAEGIIIGMHVYEYNEWKKQRNKDKE
jgi:hypothetical protein